MTTRALAFWIGLFLFSVYLLTFSGKLHVMDEFVGFAVGNNWVQHGRPDVNQFIWTNHWHTTPPGIWGRDDNLYTKKAPGISLAAAPLIWLGHTLPQLNAVHLGLLATAIVTALTGSLLVIWLVDMQISPVLAGLTALAYGLCTIAPVYARLLWEHAVMALLFLAAIWAIHRAIYNARNRHAWAWILLCGVSAATALAMRFEAALAVAIFGAFIFFYAPPALSPGNPLQFLKNKTRWLWLAIYTAIPFATSLWLLYFNFARFGSVSETGYNREILFSKPWEGAIGLLVSPSTGLFIYAPLMALLFVGLPPAWRRLPRPYLWLIWGLTLFYWLFYGSWFSWGSTWVWGPRFLLHTLPLLMLFVAYALALIARISADTPRRLAWLGVGLLALAGFVINFLGIVVDLNEHFLRLGRNDNFVFNWAAFPPLGHWRILQEGLTDIIWLQPQPDGFQIEWSVLAPALILVMLAGAGLTVIFLGIAVIKNDSLENTYAIPNRRYIIHLACQPLVFLVMLGVTLWLIYQMMLGAARVSLATAQAQADAPLLNTLRAQAGPRDALHIAMPPFGDVQELSTHMMAYLDRPLPTYAWIESEPRAIQPEERERIWRATLAQSDRVWLFERWLTQADPLSVSAARLNQLAFPVAEYWFDQSGKLTLYALPQLPANAPAAPLNVPFAGGITLVDFAVLDNPVMAGQVLKVRLTWRAAGADSQESLPPGVVIGFAHLINNESGQNAAQQDRLLLDLQRPGQSPLLPGQTVTQGYGLRLPPDLPPGNYPLLAGLYLSGSGQRLPRADASPDDFLYLTDIRVEGK